MTQKQISVVGHEMERCIRHRVLLPVLIAGLASMLAGHVRAQIFTNLYNFTGGSDGGAPYATLLLLGNTLYGTTEKSGTGVGTVFISPKAIFANIMLSFLPSRVRDPCYCREIFCL